LIKSGCCLPGRIVDEAGDSAERRLRRTSQAMLPFAEKRL
jgi:hypothetical protein